MKLPGCLLHRRLPRQRIVGDRELRLAQPLDLVAQPRRGLELEIGGRVAHAPLHVLDDRREVVADGRAVREPGVDRHVVLLVDRGHDIVDVALDALGRDAVGLVVGGLLLAPPVRLGHRALHRARHLVGVEDDAPVDVARRAADGLHERRLGAQEALLVGVENGDQRALRNIQALAQQVDPDQHVEGAEPAGRG